MHAGSRLHVCLNALLLALLATAASQADGSSSAALDPEAEPCVSKRGSPSVSIAWRVEWAFVHDAKVGQDASTGRFIDTSTRGPLLRGQAEAHANANSLPAN